MDNFDAMLDLCYHAFLEDESPFMVMDIPPEARQQIVLLLAPGSSAVDVYRLCAHTNTKVTEGLLTTALCNMTPQQSWWFQQECRLLSPSAWEVYGIPTATIQRLLRTSGGFHATSQRQEWLLEIHNVDVQEFLTDRTLRAAKRADWVRVWEHLQRLLARIPRHEQRQLFGQPERVHVHAVVRDIFQKMVDAHVLQPLAEADYQLPQEFGESPFLQLSSAGDAFLSSLSVMVPIPGLQEVAIYATSADTQSARPLASIGAMILKIAASAHDHECFCQPIMLRQEIDVQ